MSVDATTVRRIAHLARIAVADEEVEHLRGELNAICRPESGGVMRKAHHSTILGRAQRGLGISCDEKRSARMPKAHHSTIPGRAQRDPGIPCHGCAQRGRG